MDIEKIINTSLKRLTEEEELVRMAILEILHNNMDILIDNSFRWFDDNVPQEYKNVIRSLFIITTTFLTKESNYKEVVYDDKKEEVNLVNVIELIIENFNLIFGEKKFEIIRNEEEYRVVTSKNNLKKSLNIIFLSFVVFMDEASKCVIELKKDQNNIYIDIKFTDLNPSFPGIEKIQKAFFPYVRNADYHVGIGIDFALYNLRNIGSIVKVKTIDFENTGAGVYISFPSMDFQNLVEEIRGNKVSDWKSDKQGDVIVVSDDFAMDLVLGELLHENGYKIFKFGMKDDTEINPSRYKALLVDFGYIFRNKISPEEFHQFIRNHKKIILIYGEDDREKIEKYHNDNLFAMKKPISIDDIVSAIEK